MNWPQPWAPVKAYSGVLHKLGSVCKQDPAFYFQTVSLTVVAVHIIIYLFYQFVHRQVSSTIEAFRHTGKKLSAGAGGYDLDLAIFVVVETSDSCI